MFYSRSRKSGILSKEVLNFPYPASLRLLLEYKLSKTSLWSTTLNQWNVKQDTKSMSVLLTHYLSWIYKD